MRLMIAVVAALALAPVAARADKLQDAEAAFAEYDEEVALRLYSEVLAEAGSDLRLKAAALFGRGEVYAAVGRSEPALADFDAALELEKAPAQRAAILVSRAENFSRVGKAELALADYAESLKLAPEQLGVHNARGQLLQRLGRKDEALAEYEAELKRRPTNYRALVGRAVILGLPLPPNPEEGRR
jgi:tetratricopeptide (TPR) repeat protein